RWRAQGRARLCLSATTPMTSRWFGQARYVVLLLTFAAAACSGDGATGPKTGSIDLVLSGLPAGVAANVTITGPSNFSRSVGTSTTLADLTPGSYVVASEAVLVSGVRYAPRTASLTIPVVASRNAVSATVAYDVASGAIALTVAGTPSGSAGSVVITGPGAY